MDGAAHAQKTLDALTTRLSTSPFEVVYMAHDWRPSAALLHGHGHSPRILITGGLLAAMTRLPHPDSALESLFAHEIGHISHGMRAMRLRRVARFTLAAAILMTLAAALSLDPYRLAATVIGLVMTIFATLVLLRSARGREFAADAYAAQAVGPGVLIQAFRAIEWYREMAYRHIQAALYLEQHHFASLTSQDIDASGLRTIAGTALSSPLAAQELELAVMSLETAAGRAFVVPHQPAGIQRLWASHPRTADRIRRLERLGASPNGRG